MGKKLLFSAIVIVLALTSSGRAQSPPQPPAAPQPAAAPVQTAPAPTPPPAGYAWADACKSCHTPIYEAWARTKHATALDHLSAAEQDKECVGCHLTASKTKIMDGKKVLNAGIQCEGCHGPGAAHVADPKVTTGMVKSPKEALCLECHTDKSPHFRGFYFTAMVPIVHHAR